VKFRELIDEYRRWTAEILLGWAMRLYPMVTDDDRAFGTAVVAALGVALENLQRRAASGDATAKPSKIGNA